MIDRRGLRVENKDELDRTVLDRWKFDCDDEDMEEPVVVDPFDITNMRYRAAISGPSAPHPQAQTIKRQHLEASSSGGQAGANPSAANVSKEGTAAS